MDLHRLRVVEFDSLISEKEGETKNIAELGEQEDCKTLISDGNDNETNLKLESDKIFLRGNETPPESSKISSFIKYKSNSEIFHISPKDKLRQSDLKINTTLADVKKSFQHSVQNQKKRTLHLFKKKAKNEVDIKEKKAGRKKNEEVNFLFARETPSFIRYSRKRPKNENNKVHDSKIPNDVFGFQENRSVDPHLYQTSCNYLNIDKLSIKKIKKGFCRKPKPAPVRECFCKHHAMRVLTSTVTDSGKKDNRPSIYYNLNVHSCPRRTRLKRNNSLYEEVWAREQPLFLAKDKNVEVSPSSLLPVAKSYCNANVGPSQIQLTSRSQHPTSGTRGDALSIHRKVPTRRNKPYPQHSTPSPSSESNGPEQYQPQVVHCKRKRTDAKKILSIINSQRTKLFSGIFQRVNAFHIRNNASGKKCIKYAFFGLLIVVWSPCLLAVILAWAVMCPVRLTNVLNTNKTKSLFPVLSSFVNKFRKKSPRSDYEQMCFGDYSYPQKRNCRTSVANWYARAAHTVVNSYNALLSMFKIRNKPPTCAGSSFLTSSHPNPKKRYTLFYADNRGWMMKPARRNNARSFPSNRVVQTMRCEFRPKFWRKAPENCRNSSCNCVNRGARKRKTVSTEKSQMKVRSSQKLCCDCPPPRGVQKRKTISKEKAQMKTGSSQKTCECPVPCGCPAHRKIPCECLAHGKTSCICPARGTISCDCPVHGAKGGTICCKCPPGGPVSCACPVHGAKGGKISCECPVHAAKNVQKNSGKASAAGDAFSVPSKTLSGCICRDVMYKEGVQCICSKSSTKYIPQRNQVNILRNYFYPTSGVVFNPTVYQTTQTKPNNQNSINISHSSHNDFAKYRLGQRKNGTLPFGVVVDCGTKHPLIMNKKTYGTHSFGLAGKTLKMSTKYIPNCNKKYLQGQSSTKRSSKYESNTNGKKSLNIQRTAVNEIAKTVLPPKLTPRFKTNSSRGHSTKCEIALNCPCGTKNHNTSITDKKILGNFSRERLRTRNQSVLALLSEAVITKQTGTSTDRINYADKTQSISKQHILGQKEIGKSKNTPKHTLNQKVRLVREQDNGLQKQQNSKTPKDCIRTFNCPCKNELSVGTETVRPEQIVSNKKAVECRCNTEKQSSTTAEEHFSKQSVSKCACKDESSTKKEKPRTEKRSLDKKEIDCGCMTKTQSNSGSLIQSALNCPCQSEQNVGTETLRTGQILSDKKAVDCRCSIEKKSIRAAKELPSKQPVFKCACKDKTGTNKEKLRPDQSLPDKKAIDCGCMTETQPKTGKSPAIETALNCPCKNELSVATEAMRLKQVASNKKTVDCRCSAEKTSSIAAKEIPSKQPEFKCACKDEPTTEKEKPPRPEKSLTDKKVIDSGCMTETQPKTGKRPAVQTALNCPCENELSIGTQTVRPKETVSGKKAVDCRCSAEKKSSIAAKEIPSKQPVFKCACKYEPSTEKEKPPRLEKSLTDKKVIDSGCMTETQPKTGKRPAIQTALNCPCENELSIGTQTVRPKETVSDTKAVDVRSSLEKNSITAAKELPSKQPVFKCACKDEPSNKKEKPRPKKSLPNKKAIDCGCMTETQPKTGKRPAIQIALNCPCENELSVGIQTVRPKETVSDTKAVDVRSSIEKNSITAAKELPSKQPVFKCACKDEPSTEKEKPPRLEKSLTDKKVIDSGCMTETQPKTGKRPAIQTALNCPCENELSVGTQTVRSKENVLDKKAVDGRFSIEKNLNTAAKELPSKQPVFKCACKDEPSTKKEKPRPGKSLSDKKAIDCGCMTETQPKTGKRPAIQTALNCPCENELSIGTQTVRPKETVSDKKAVDGRSSIENNSITAAKKLPSKQPVFKCACKDEPSTKKEMLRPEQNLPEKKAIDCRCRTVKKPSAAAQEHVQSIVTDSETNTSGHKLQTKSLEQLSLKVNISEDHSLKCKTALCPCVDKHRLTAIASEMKASESSKQLSQTKSNSKQVPIKKKITALLRRSVLTQKSSSQYKENTNDKQIDPPKKFKATTIDRGYGTHSHASTITITHPIQHQRHAIEAAEKQVILTQRATKCVCINVPSNSKHQPSAHETAAKCDCWPKKLSTATTANNTESLNTRNESTTPLSTQRVTNNNKQQQTNELEKKVPSQQENDSQFGIALNCPCGNDTQIVSSQEAIRQPPSLSNGTGSDFARKTQPKIATDNNNVKLKSTTAVQTDKPPNQILKPLSSQQVINNNKRQQTEPSDVLPKEGSSQIENDSQFGVALNCSCGNESEVVSAQETGIRKPLNQSHRIDSNSVPKTQPRIAADNNNMKLKSPPTVTTADQTGSSDKHQSELLKPLSNQPVINNNKQQQTEPSYVLPQQPSSQLYGIAPDCPCQTQPQIAVDNNTKSKKPPRVNTFEKTSSDKSQSEILKPFSDHQVINGNKQGQPPTYGLPKQVSSQQAKDSLFGVALNCPCGNDIIKTQETGTRKPSLASECTCKIKSPVSAENKSTNTYQNGSEEKHPSQQPKAQKTKSHKPQKQSKSSECACEIESQTANNNENTYKTETPPKRQTKSPKSHTQSRTSKKLLKDKRSMYTNENGLADYTPKQAIDCPCENAIDERNYSPPPNIRQRIKSSKTPYAEPPSTTKNGIYSPNRHTQTQPSMFGISSDCACETYEPIDRVDKIQQSRTAGLDHHSKVPMHPLSQRKKATQTRSKGLPDYQQSNNRSHAYETNLDQQKKHVQAGTKCNCKHKSSISWCKKRAIQCICRPRKDKGGENEAQQSHLLDKALNKTGASISRRETNLGKRTSSLKKTKSDQRSSLSKRLSKCTCEFQRKQSSSFYSFKNVIGSRNTVTPRSQSHSTEQASVLKKSPHTDCKCPPEKKNASQPSHRSWNPTQSDKSRSRLSGFNKNRQPQVSLQNKSACLCSYENIQKKSDRIVPRETKSLKQSSKRSLDKTACSCPPSGKLPSGMSKLSRLVMKLRSKFCSSKKSQQSKIKLSNHKPVTVHSNPSKCACSVSNPSLQLKFKEKGKPSKQSRTFLQCLGVGSQKSKTSQTISYIGNSECRCTIDKISSSKSLTRGKSPRSLSRYNHSSGQSQQTNLPMNSRRYKKRAIQCICRPRKDKGNENEGQQSHLLDKALNKTGASISQRETNLGKRTSLKKTKSDQRSSLSKRLSECTCEFQRKQSSSFYSFKNVISSRNTVTHTSQSHSTQQASVLTKSPDTDCKCPPKKNNASQPSHRSWNPTQSDKSRSRLSGFNKNRQPQVSLQNKSACICSYEKIKKKSDTIVPRETKSLKQSSKKSLDKTACSCPPSGKSSSGKSDLSRLVMKLRSKFCSSKKSKQSKIKLSNHKPVTVHSNPSKCACPVSNPSLQLKFKQKGKPSKQSRSFLQRLGVGSQKSKTSQTISYIGNSECRCTIDKISSSKSLTRGKPPRSLSYNQSSRQSQRTNLPMNSRTSHSTTRTECRCSYEHSNLRNCACSVTNSSLQLKFKQKGKPSKQSRSFLQRLGVGRQKAKTSQTISYIGNTECGCTIDKISSSKSLTRGKPPRSLSRYNQSSRQSERTNLPMNSRTSHSTTRSECCCSIKKTYSRVSSPCSRKECGCPIKPKLFKGNKKQYKKSPNSSIVMSLTPIECSRTSSTQNGENVHNLTPQYVSGQQHKISQFPSFLYRSHVPASRKLFTNSQPIKPDSQYFSGQQTILTQFPSPLHNEQPTSTNSTKKSRLLSDSVPQQHSDHIILYSAPPSAKKISRSLNVQTAPIIPGKCACLSEKLRQLSDKISHNSHSNTSQQTPLAAKQKINSDTLLQDPRKTKIETERPRAYSQHLPSQQPNNSKDSRRHISSQIASDKQSLPTETVSLSPPTPTIEPKNQKPPEFPQHFSTELPKQDLPYRPPQSKQLPEKLGNDIIPPQPPKTPLEKDSPQNSQRYPNRHIMRPYPYDPSRPIVPIIPGMCTCAVKQRLSEYLRKIAQANKPQQNISQPEISDPSSGLHSVPTPLTDEKQVLSDTVSHHSHKAITGIEGPLELSQSPKRLSPSSAQPLPFAKERRLQSDVVSNFPRKTMTGTEEFALPSQSPQSQKQEIPKPVTKQRLLSDKVSQHSRQPMLETDSKLTQTLHKTPPRTEGYLKISHNRATQNSEISKYSDNHVSPPIPAIEKQRLQGSILEHPRKTHIGTEGQPELLHNLPSQQPEGSRPFHDFHPTRIIPGKCTCSDNKYENSLEVVANHIKTDLAESKLQPEPLHHLSYQFHKMPNNPPQNVQQSHMISRAYTNSANKLPRLRTNIHNYSNIKGPTEKLLDMSQHVIIQRSEILQSPQNIQTSHQLKQIFSVLKRNMCECPTEESNISPEETALVDKHPGLLQRRSGQVQKGEAVGGVKQSSKPVKQQPYPDFNRVTMRYPARKRSEQSPGSKRKEHIPPPAKKNYPPAVGVSPPPNYARRPCYANPANKCGPKTCFDESALRRAYKRRPLRYTPPKQQPKSKKTKQNMKDIKKDKKKDKQKIKKAVTATRKPISRPRFNIFQCCQCVQELVKEAEKDAWPTDVSCRPIYIHALKRKPCFWIFKWFPSIYPAFLGCFKLQQNICQMCLYVLALCLWSPFLLCFYVCFNLICKS